MKFIRFLFLNYVGYITGESMQVFSCAIPLGILYFLCLLV